MAVKANDVASKLEDLSPYDYFPYATYVEGRTNGGDSWKSFYKRHKTLTHAKLSLRASRGGEKRLYEWDMKRIEWVELPID